MTAPGKTRHVAFRLDDDTIARVDALTPSLSTPWHEAKRSDALRALVIEALPVLEARGTKPTKGGRR